MVLWLNLGWYQCQCINAQIMHHILVDDG